MPVKKLDDLFLHTLQDIYHGEKQILRALPKMAKAAQSGELRNLLEQHRAETQGQVDRLEQVFEQLDRRARGKTCQGIQALIEEGKEVMDEAEGETLDAGMIAAEQAIEHYEIARYGTLVAWAKQLGHKDAARLLEKTLEEEKKADQLLNKIALEQTNKRAA